MVGSLYKISTIVVNSFFIACILVGSLNNARGGIDDETPRQSATPSSEPSAKRGPSEQEAVLEKERSFQRFLGHINILSQEIKESIGCNDKNKVLQTYKTAQSLEASEEEFERARIDLSLLKW